MGVPSLPLKKVKFFIHTYKAFHARGITPPVIRCTVLQDTYVSWHHWCPIEVPLKHLEHNGSMASRCVRETLKWNLLRFN